MPEFIRLLIYTTLGLFTVTIISYILGFIIINKFVLFSIIVIFILPIIRGTKKINYNFVYIRKFLSLDNVVPFILFIITFTYFIKVIGIFKWPPPGDIFNHGLYTSILIYNQKITTTLGPYAPSVLAIPAISGIHVMSALISMITGIFPGEAVFIMGGVISILIPLILYSLVFLYTRSILFSLMGFFSVFLIGPGLERWIYGYFYNGPYPNLFGFLAIIFFITYQKIQNDYGNETSDSKRKNVVTIIIILGVLFTYPPFVVYPLLYYTLLTICDKNTRENTIINIKKLAYSYPPLVIIITFLFIVASMIMNRNFLLQILRGLISYLSKAYGRLSYSIYVPLFYKSAIGVAIIVAGFISILFLVKQLHYNLGLFYLIIFVPVMFSLHPALFPYFSLILPNRSLMLCALISWVLILILISDIFPNYENISIRLTFQNHQYLGRCKVNYKALFSSLCLLIVFVPSLVTTLQFEPAHRYSWLLRHGFTDDYDVLLWASENILSDALIMNDYSYDSRYLLSFSLKNVSSKYHFDTDYERNRAIEIQYFWENKLDNGMLFKLIEKYNVSYILVTSQKSYHNWVGINGDDRYTTKAFKPEEYKIFFNDLPLLELMFEKGESGIYRIKKPFKYIKSYALQFDGLSNYIKVNHDVSIMPSKAISISFWINMKNLPSVDSYIISKYDDYKGYEISYRWNKKISLCINNEIILQSNKIFNNTNINKWWHIVVTYNESKACIYINGVIDAISENVCGIDYNSSPLLIGCRNFINPYGFVPSIFVDDIYIYDRGLSSNEVMGLYKNIDVEKDFVLYFPLNEKEGNVLYDMSNYDNIGIMDGLNGIEYYSVIIGDDVYKIN